MNDTRSREVAGLLAALAAAFVVVLFFDWQTVNVGVAGVISVNVSTGWAGWGIVAGITGIALLVYALLEVSGYIPEDQGTEIAPAVLGLILCAATIAHYTTLTSVNVVDTVTVDVSRSSAATIGLVLAIAIAVVAVGRLILRGPAFSGRSHPAH